MMLMTLQRLIQVHCYVFCKAWFKILFKLLKSDLKQIEISEFYLIVCNITVYYKAMIYLQIQTVHSTNYRESNKPLALSFGQIDPINCYAWVFLVDK